MASITIMKGHRNLVFAAGVANDTGAEFEERGDWITISASPELTIPRYTFDQAFDPEGQRSMRGESLEHAWRALLLNKDGYLVRFDDMEIVVADEKPSDSKGRTFLLRFPSERAKAEAEGWADRAEFPSLTEYIVEAVSTFNDFWREKAGEASQPDRTQEVDQIRQLAADAFASDRLGIAGGNYESAEAYTDALLSTIEHDLDEHDAGLLRRFVLEMAESAWEQHEE